MEHRVALSHACGIAAEAILEKLPESGIKANSLVLLDREANTGKRLSYAGSYQVVENQGDFDFSDCSLFLMPETDPELESMALSQGCLLVSHAIDNDTPPVFITHGGPPPEIGYTQTSVRLVDPELSCLLPVLLELNQAYTIEQLNITLLRSAEFQTRIGIDELASQTISLLNSQAAEPSVFAQQIAFNLLPELADPQIGSDLAVFLGTSSYSGMLQTVNVPVFHGLVAAVQLRFDCDLSLQECIRRLAALDNVVVNNGPISPIIDCNQLFSCILGRFEQAPNEASSLQFWMITDPMRYGLANNYVNVSDFLLKSFL